MESEIVPGDYIRVDMISGAIAIGTVIMPFRGWIRMHCDTMRRGPGEEQIDQEIYLNLAHACAIWPLEDDDDGDDPNDDDDDKEA